MISPIYYNYPNHAILHEQESKSFSYHKTNTTYPTSKIAAPNFKGQLETDTVTIGTKIKKNKKKDLSKGAKLAIGLGTILAILAGGFFVTKKINYNKIMKLYDEKLVLKNLPEKIDFQNAESLDDAIKFSQEILGVKNLSGFDKFPKKEALEALNWTNKALVDVSNAHKGKLFIPQNIIFEPIEDKNVLAFVKQNIQDKSFGDLTINSNYFNNNFINKTLIDWFESLDKLPNVKFHKFDFDNIFFDLKNKFLEDQNSLSLREKISLFQTKGAFFDNIQTMNNPIMFFKNNEHLFKQNGIEIDFDSLAKLPSKELFAKQRNLLEELFKVRNTPYITHTPLIDAGKIVYHEMGHLQDFTINLRKLDLQDKNTRNLLKNYNVGDRWIRKDQCESILGNSISKTKEIMPNFFEFITNEETQRTASKVSSYACCGIGEFIAETYAKILQGQKLDDDVIALYKKYNGPLANRF